MIPVRDFDSVQSLNNACEGLLREVLQAETSAPNAAMLSGGRTPLALFNQIAENPFPVSANAWLTYTDDRHVPTDSPESNFGATLPMINALGLPLEHVIRVDTSAPLEIFRCPLPCRLRLIFQPWRPHRGRLSRYGRRWPHLLPVLAGRYRSRRGKTRLADVATHPAAPCDRGAGPLGAVRAHHLFGHRCRQGGCHPTAFGNPFGNPRRPRNGQLPQCRALARLSACSVIPYAVCTTG